MIERFQYDNKIVKAFLLATIVFGIVGMLVGLIVAVELVAQVAGTDQPELAQAFMDWVLNPDFQATIPLANWSLPAKMPQDDWPQVMRDLPRPEKTLFYSEDEAEALRQPALDEWLRAFAG